MDFIHYFNCYIFGFKELRTLLIKTDEVKIANNHLNTPFSKYYFNKPTVFKISTISKPVS